MILLSLSELDSSGLLPAKCLNVCASETLNYGEIKFMALDEYKDNKINTTVLHKHHRLASYSSQSFF